MGTSKGPLGTVSGSFGVAATVLWCLSQILGPITPRTTMRDTTGAGGRTRGLIMSCQLRLKIPQSTGRKIPSPQQVVVDGFIRLLEVGNRLVKRRWALVETNPPRNSWPQTHQDDEARDEAGRGIVPGPGIVIGLIDLPMPQKTHARASRLLPRASATAACGSSLGASTAGIRPALRRSFSL